MPTKKLTPEQQQQELEQQRLISEARLQQECLIWLNRYHRAAEEWFFAVPNGGKRDKREAATLKATGTKRGVADTFLPEPRGRYHGLFIELKIPEGVLSADQIRFIKAMRAKGYAAVVIDTLHAFQALITEYLALTGTQDLPNHHYYRFSL